MLILLEGPDLAGKSTFAEMLHDEILARFPEDTVKMLHAGPPRKHPLDEYVTPLLEYVPGRGEHIICDRWHVGESVYPKLKGRGSDMTWSVRRYIEMFLRARGALLVGLIPGTATLTERYHDRGDAIQSLDIVLAAQREFVIAMNTSNVHQIRSDVNNAVFMHEVLASATRCERFAQPVAGLQSYIGHTAPNTIYVSDRKPCEGGRACRHSTRHHALAPALMPHRGSPGAVLMDSLPTSNLIGVVNLFDEADLKPLLLSRTLNGERVNIVALGRAVQERLKSMGNIHGVTTVPHPEWVRRFGKSDIQRYRRTLEHIDGEEHMWRS